MSDVTLHRMTDEELAVYLDAAIPEYAHENMRVGRGQTEEAALEASRKTYATLLPDGVKSEGQHVLTIRDGATGEKVGMIWFGRREEEGHAFAFIWDFRIDEDKRGSGYGSRALAALEDEVRKAGLDEIYLHAFGHNDGAIRLYQRTGYLIKDVLMGKQL